MHPVENKILNYLLDKIRKTVSFPEEKTKERSILHFRSIRRRCQSISMRARLR